MEPVSPRDPSSVREQACDTTLLDHAHRIQLRAIRRYGQLIEQIPKTKPPGKAQNSEIGLPSIPISARQQAAAQGGLTAMQHKTAVGIAKIPQAEFDRLVDGPNPPPRSGVVRLPLLLVAVAYWLHMLFLLPQTPPLALRQLLRPLQKPVVLQHEALPRRPRHRMATSFPRPINLPVNVEHLRHLALRHTQRRPHLQQPRAGRGAVVGQQEAWNGHGAQFGTPKNFPENLGRVCAHDHPHRERDHPSLGFLAARAWGPAAACEIIEAMLIDYTPSLASDFERWRQSAE